MGKHIEISIPPFGGQHDAIIAQQKRGCLMDIVLVLPAGMTVCESLITAEPL